MMADLVPHRVLHVNCGNYGMLYVPHAVLIPPGECRVHTYSTVCLHYWVEVRSE